MEAIWEIAVSTAGLGAVSCLLLWSLYKQWLQLPILEKLTKSQLFYLFKLFLVLTFLLSTGALLSYSYVEQLKHQSNVNTFRPIDVLRQKTELINVLNEIEEFAEVKIYKDSFGAISKLRSLGEVAFKSERYGESHASYTEALMLAINLKNFVNLESIATKDLRNYFKDSLITKIYGEPLLMGSGETEASISFDTGGRIVRKETKSYILSVEYNDHFNKLSRYTLISKKRSAEPKWLSELPERYWVDYRYNKKGSLTKLGASNGEMLLLIYHRRGYVSRLIHKSGDDNAKRLAMYLKYNQNGKPSNIEVDGVGAIEITYTGLGEIDKVTSSSGNGVAQNISSIYQKLLQLIQPPSDLRHAVSAKG